jgi:hypothetical protein
MKQRRMIPLVLIAMVWSILLSGCAPYEYDGKDIESIAYVTIDYFGDHRQETIIDLEEGDVRTRAYGSQDETIPDYEVAFTFDVEDVPSFLDAFGASGVFDLEERYETNEVIMDGGGWVLTIRYADGSVKTSTGDNVWPQEVFEEADMATMDLYGDDLFGTSP